MTVHGGSSTRVYVDAKIIGMHDKALPKETYVGYYVEGTNEHDSKPVHADESDDAEIEAVLFAIEKLATKFDRLVVICDHESVVSEAKRESVKKPTALLEKLRRTLHENPSIDLEGLKANPAHKILTEYVNRLKQDSASG